MIKKIMLEYKILEGRGETGGRRGVRGSRRGEGGGKGQPGKGDVKLTQHKAK